MPSSALVAISEDIEKLNTDSLGKFYMYVALLHSITVRADKKKFDELLPKDTRMLSQGFSLMGRQLLLDTGTPQVTFYENIQAYRKQFDHKPSEFDVLAVAKKLVLAYFRKGQLGDLAFINERMLSHLEMLPQSLKQNLSIHSSIGFDGMQADIRQLLQVAKAVHTNGFACVDNGIKASIAVVVAMLGLIAVVSLTHVFVGLAMMAAGGVGAYLFFQQLERAFLQMDGLIQTCAETAKKMYAAAQGVRAEKGSILGLGIEKVTEDPLRKSFLVESIIMPLDYSGVTISEQLSLSYKTYDGADVSVETVRAGLDQRYGLSR